MHVDITRYYIFGFEILTAVTGDYDLWSEKEEVRFSCLLSSYPNRLRNDITIALKHRQYGCNWCEQISVFISTLEYKTTPWCVSDFVAINAKKKNQCYERCRFIKRTLVSTETDVFKHKSVFLYSEIARICRDSWFSLKGNLIPLLQHVNMPYCFRESLRKEIGNGLDIWVYVPIRAFSTWATEM